MRIRPAESLRIPEEGSSAQGESGPKPRPKGVGDGERVDIPVPPGSRLSEGVTQVGRPAGGWKSLSKRVGGTVGKSAVRKRRDVMGSDPARGGELVDPGLPRKASSERSGARTANRHR